MRSNLRLNDRGSAMIDIVVAGPIVAIVLATGLYLLYLSYAKVWMSRSAREAAICLVTPVSPQQCRRKLEATLEIGLPFGESEITEFRSDSSGSHVGISLDVEIQTVRMAQDDLAPRRIQISNSVARSN